MAQRLKIASLKDFLAYAKANPGKLNYGSGGNGSAGHLGGEIFKQRGGFFAVHIPYAGGAPSQLCTHQALHIIAKAVRRGRIGLRDPGKPVGSFLCLGPTGVGKTELAKALAEFLFDDEAALVRFATRVLDRLGYVVTGQTDPEEALRALERTMARVPEPARTDLDRRRGAASWGVARLWAL